MAQLPFLTADGYEGQFGVNHMGHFLFTRLLLPTLLSTSKLANSDVRIINLSSGGHNFAPPNGGFLPETVKTEMAEWSTWRRYGQSKLANVLFTHELARRHPGITSVAIHPGSVQTNLGLAFMSRYPRATWMASWVIAPFVRTVENGALNQLWAVSAKKGEKAKEVRSGAYYVPLANAEGESRWAKDESLAKKLWEWSEGEVEEKGY